MKRHYEDQSLDLIGRSAAERRLDRFYNHQKSQIQKGEVSVAGRGDVLVALSSTSVPFPERNKDPEVKRVKVEQEAPKKDLKEILSDISTKYLPQKSKFLKSLKLLVKLSRAYFEGGFKTEEGVSYLDFFEVFSVCNDVFVRDYAGIVPKDSLEEKESLVEFIKIISSISNIKELELSLEDEMYLEYLKTSIGYPAELWYETDPFKFHKIASELKTRFNRLEEETNNEFTRCDVSHTHKIPWSTPTRNELVTLELKAYTRTLGVVFTFFHHTWAKSSIEPLYQHIYLKRWTEQESHYTPLLHIFLRRAFDEGDQTRISEWQSHINANRSKSSKSVNVQRIGEANFQLKDGKEEKIISTHGSQIWCQKQLL